MPCASMMQNESDAYRKIRLRVEDVQGKNCLTNFWVCQTAHAVPTTRMQVHQKQEQSQVTWCCLLM